MIHDQNQLDKILKGFPGEKGVEVAGFFIVHGFPWDFGNRGDNWGKVAQNCMKIKEFEGRGIWG